MSARGDDVLTPSECLALLTQVEIGRIALSIDALPVIIPVAFAVIDEHVHFWILRDPKLDAAVDNQVVAFESGAYDPEDGTGWSVLVQGMTQAVHRSDPPGSPPPASPAPPERSAASDDRYRMMRIQPGVVTGQRIRTMLRCVSPLGGSGSSGRSPAHSPWSSCPSPP
jgi:uncharacterized protein